MVSEELRRVTAMTWSGGSVTGLQTDQFGGDLNLHVYSDTGPST
jgi:hypothetical protein